MLAASAAGYPIRYVAERSKSDSNKSKEDGELLCSEVLCRWRCLVLAPDFLLGNSEQRHIFGPSLETVDFVGGWVLRGDSGLQALSAGVECYH